DPRRRADEPAADLPRRRAAPDRELVPPRGLRGAPAAPLLAAALLARRRARRATYSFLLGPVAGLIHKETHEVPEHRLASIYCVPAPPEKEEFERKFGTKILSQ